VDAAWLMGVWGDEVPPLCGWERTERATGGSALALVASLVADLVIRPVKTESGLREMAPGRAGRVVERALCGERVGGGGTGTRLGGARWARSSLVADHIIQEALMKDTILVFMLYLTFFESGWYCPDLFKMMFTF